MFKTYNNKPKFRSFLKDTLHGLSCSSKNLSSLYFYDNLGSHYFEEICKQPEYYQTKADIETIKIAATDLGKTFTQPIALCEYGAGTFEKFAALKNNWQTICDYLAIDISGDHLKNIATKINDTYPDLNVSCLIDDFSTAKSLPKFTKHENIFGFFPGSTLGNFDLPDATELLMTFAKQLGKNANLLISIDINQAPETLNPAYNDQKGYTQQFNKNILTRIKTELNADVDIDIFEHLAFYNQSKNRIEMHLVAKEKTIITIDEQCFSLARDESIHTESSYKYTDKMIDKLIAPTVWQLQKKWIDKSQKFCIMYLKYV